MTKHAMILILPIFFLLFTIHCRFTAVMPLLKRLRWLFLSLFVLNLWFNSPELKWLPTSIDLLRALERVTVLIIIVLAAHLLVQVTLPQDMMSALRWWLAPLKKIGFPSEQLAVRLTLVLETVQTVQGFYDQQATPSVTPPSQPQPKQGGWCKWTRMKIGINDSIQRMSSIATDLFIQVFNRAENASLRILELPEPTAPPLWQWSYPLLLLALIMIEI